MSRVYFSVKPSETQNCSSAKARAKLSRPMYGGGVMSDQLLSETQIIWMNG